MPPEEVWVVCNTDGVNRGNPGRSTYGFCIRNREGNLLYADSKSMETCTNMEAEAQAIWRALSYFRDT